MPTTPIHDAATVPAATLFPSWRGLVPYAGRLAPVRAALGAAYPGLDAAIDAVPLDIFEAAWGPGAAVHKYNEVPDAARAVLARAPDALHAAYLCALLIERIGGFDEAFADSGLPAEFALHYADAFHRILDQIEADPGFAVLTRDAFLKDLWLTRVVMIPAFAQIWWPRSGLSAKAVVRGGVGAAAYVFLTCGGRRPFMEGHTHDPMAGAYWNEAGWGEALRLAALAIPALPQVKGVFGTAWFYDPAILAISARIGFAQSLQVGRGARRIRIGSNDAAIANATGTSPTRRQMYAAGTYLPTDYAVIWSRRDLRQAYGQAQPSST